jgi:acetylornithine deacetylase/succinyl-diaminopimelate desuccinylase-like protein
MTARGPLSHSSPQFAPKGVALALLAAVTFSGVSPFAHAIWPFDGGDDRPLGERAAEILSRAIAIPTVNPPGNEAPLAAYLVEVARKANLETRLIPIPSADDEGKETRRAAAWARLAGGVSEEKRGRPIILLSHLDVVPANPDEWAVPPFEGRIEDGDVIGRGALDAKGVAVIQLMALIELSKRDAPLKRDVIFLATPDEESGGVHGAGYLVQEQPELLGDAEFLLTEGGNIRAPTSQTPSVWGVAVIEKSPCWLELSARGPAGHTSTPSPDAAVPRLIGALDSVRRIETRVRVLPEVQRMFAAMAPVASPEDQAGYRDLRAALAGDRRFRHRFLANPARNALVRDTISISVVEGAARTNVAPARAYAHLDARLLPGGRCVDFATAIGNVVSEESVSVETLLAFPSISSPIDTDLYRAIEAVAARVDPDGIVVPRMTAGFTDAHYFRSLGIVAYGFVPRWLSADETRGIHGANERVSTANLERGTRTLVAILEELGA